MPASWGCPSRPHRPHLGQTEAQMGKKPPPPPRGPDATVRQSNWKSRLGPAGPTEAAPPQARLQGPHSETGSARPGAPPSWKGPWDRVPQLRGCRAPTSVRNRQARLGAALYTPGGEDAKPLERIHVSQEHGDAPACPREGPPGSWVGVGGPSHAHLRPRVGGGWGGARRHHRRAWEPVPWVIRVALGQRTPELRAQQPR